MMMLDWNSPKITVQDLDTFLRNYLKEKLDGIVIQDSRVVINTLVDVLPEEETYIKNWFYSINDKPQNVLAQVTSSAPYADPTYRTKLDAAGSVITVAPGSCEKILYRVTEERYVSGGELMSTGSELGDYITASVEDTDGLIPVPYRSALCENWPTVAQYIIKRWINPAGLTKIDTRPLNAKITEGLYLQISYCACSEGTSRKVVMNYDLTKKI
jgi:hypothetical protein